MNNQPAILIESKIRREGGTRVTLGDVHYHFRPYTDGGPHVAKVANPDHQAKFLSVTEGYRFIGPAATSGEVTQQATARGATGPVIEPPASPPPAPTPEPADGAQTDRTKPSDDAPPPEMPEPAEDEQPPAAPPSDSTALESMTDEQLRAEYEAALERKPHPNAKPETMIASIKAKRAETA